jgi:hypothetical protein
LSAAMLWLASQAKAANVLNRQANDGFIAGNHQG